VSTTPRVTKRRSSVVSNSDSSDNVSSRTRLSGATTPLPPSNPPRRGLQPYFYPTPSAEDWEVHQHSALAIASEASRVAAMEARQDRRITRGSTSMNFRADTKRRSSVVSSLPEKEKERKRERVCV